MNYVLHKGKRIYKDQLVNYIPEDLNKIIESKSNIVIISDDVLLIVSLIKQYYKTNKKLLFVHRSNYSQSIKDIINETGYNILEIVDEEIEIIEHESEINNNGEISIFTSGTTGLPKLIEHTWTSLNTFGKVNTREKNNWFLTYAPTSYAWYQMVLMFLEVDGQNLIIPSVQSTNLIFEDIDPSAVTAMSSTPSFWRYQLFNNSQFLEKLKLKQITLGGEFVDQNILDTLKNLYPDSNISHIYASTEAGANIVVHDKKEGFPIDWLETKKESIKIIDESLYLRSKFSSLENQNNWYNTKDQVKIENERIVVIGRMGSRVVNVGGNKVNLNFIENIIKNNSNVLYCRVFTKKSPIVNNIIVAEIIPKNNLKLDEIENDLYNFCKSNGVQDWMIPRRFYLAKNIEVSQNFKITEESVV